MTKEETEREQDAVFAVTTGHAQLIEYKRIGCSRIPKELDWEIKLYEFILNSGENVGKRARLYCDARHAGMPAGRARPKREVAARLGWEL